MGPPLSEFRIDCVLIPSRCWEGRTFKRFALRFTRGIYPGVRCRAALRGSGAGVTPSGYLSPGSGVCDRRVLCLIYVYLKELNLVTGLDAKGVHGVP